MQVIFESRATQGRQLQALAEQRIRFVLRRQVRQRPFAADL